MTKGVEVFHKMLQSFWVILFFNSWHQ